MKNWLNKPFPFIESSKMRFFISLFFALFIYAFLLIYQPYHISQIQYNKAIFLIGFFASTFVVLIITYIIIPLMFRKTFNPDSWTVGKNIYLTICQLLGVALLNWFYNSSVGKDISIQFSFLNFILITTGIGFFPMAFLTIYLEKLLTRNHETIAIELTNKIILPKQEISTQEVKIVSETEKDFLQIALNKLFCIQSEGNYALVFYNDNNGIKKRLIRNSLNIIGEQLADYEHIQRCHRSYIVNLENVIRVTGNARNYNFIIDKLDFSIPVSRTFPKEIIENIAK